jgi:hypothetical protein
MKLGAIPARKDFEGAVAEMIQLDPGEISRVLSELFKSEGVPAIVQELKAIAKRHGASFDQTAPRVMVAGVILGIFAERARQLGLRAV